MSGSPRRSINSHFKNITHRRNGEQISQPADSKPSKLHSTRAYRIPEPLEQRTSQADRLESSPEPCKLKNKSHSTPSHSRNHNQNHHTTPSSSASPSHAPKDFPKTNKAHSITNLPSLTTTRNSSNITNNITNNNHSTPPPLAPPTSTTTTTLKPHPATPQPQPQPTPLPLRSYPPSLQPWAELPKTSPRARAKAPLAWAAVSAT